MSDASCQKCKDPGTHRFLIMTGDGKWECDECFSPEAGWMIHTQKKGERPEAPAQLTSLILSS